MKQILFVIFLVSVCGTDTKILESCQDSSIQGEGRSGWYLKCIEGKLILSSCGYRRYFDPKLRLCREGRSLSEFSFNEEQPTLNKYSSKIEDILTKKVNGLLNVESKPREHRKSIKRPNMSRVGDLKAVAQVGKSLPTFPTTLLTTKKLPTFPSTVIPFAIVSDASINYMSTGTEWTVTEESSPLIPTGTEWVYTDPSSDISIWTVSPFTNTKHSGSSTNIWTITENPTIVTGTDQTNTLATGTEWTVTEPSSPISTMTEWPETDSTSHKTDKTSKFTTQWPETESPRWKTTKDVTGTPWPEHGTTQPEGITGTPWPETEEPSKGTSLSSTNTEWPETEVPTRRRKKRLIFKSTIWPETDGTPDVSKRTHTPSNTPWPETDKTPEVTKHGDSTATPWPETAGTPEVTKHGHQTSTPWPETDVTLNEDKVNKKNVTHKQSGDFKLSLRN